jgi:hypothetical protein
VTDDNENDLFAMLRLCGFSDVVDLLRAQQTEIENLQDDIKTLSNRLESLGYEPNAILEWRKAVRRSRQVRYG